MPARTYRAQPLARQPWDLYLLKVFLAEIIGANQRVSVTPSAAMPRASIETASCAAKTEKMAP